MMTRSLGRFALTFVLFGAAGLIAVGPAQA